MNERWCCKCVYSIGTINNIYGTEYLCRRFPPIFIMWPSGEGMQHVVDFPPVSGNDFCGEFKEKKHDI